MSRCAKCGRPTTREAGETKLSDAALLCPRCAFIVARVAHYFGRADVTPEEARCRAREMHDLREDIAEYDAALRRHRP